MYQYGLEVAGFDVVPAYSGASAIAQARERAPDVIVLDLRLGDISGWKVCEILKADAATAQIPVVILTAAASTTVPIEAMESGCVAYLVKPCYPDELAQTIRAALRAVESGDVR